MVSDRNASSNFVTMLDRETDEWQQSAVTKQFKPNFSGVTTFFGSTLNTARGVLQVFGQGT